MKSKNTHQKRSSPKRVLYSISTTQKQSFSTHLVLPIHAVPTDLQSMISFHGAVPSRGSLSVRPSSCDIGWS